MIAPAFSAASGIASSAYGFSMALVSDSSAFPDRRARRPWRMLPSVGATIRLRDVAGAWWNAVRGDARQDELTMARVLMEVTGLRSWILTSSGRAAIAAVLAAWRRQRPDCDEVIIPAYTSYSVPAAIVRAGLRVRLCDIEPETLGLDPEVLLSAVTPRTLCILANHLYGLPSRMTEVRDVAQARGIPLIEDAAQALGIRCAGRPGGAYGDAAIYSVSRGKILPGAGGGMLATNDTELAAACRAEIQSPAGRMDSVQQAVTAMAMALFLRPSLYRLPASLPFLKIGASWYEPDFPVGPMTGFQASLLLRLLARERAIRQSREQQAARLREALVTTGVTVLWPRAQDEGAYLRLIVLMPDAASRDKALQALQNAGLGATEGYPLPLPTLPPLEPSLVERRPCPVAEWVSQRLLTLPTHPWVTEQDCQRIAEIMAPCT